MKSSSCAGDSEWRLVGPNRYEVRIELPWGVLELAEVLVSTHVGWPARREARDPRWVAYLVGPAVLAIRLKGGLTPWNVRVRKRIRVGQS